MACSTCGYSPCTCQTPIYQYNWLNIENYPCNPCSSTVVCKIKVPGQCVFYDGPALTCLNLGTGINYDLIIATLAQTICDLQECCNQECVGLVVPDFTLPVATEGNIYVYQFIVSGTTPINISSIVKPVWLNISLIGNVVTFNGTPPITGTPSNTIVTFNLSNECSSINIVKTLNIEATVVECFNLINVDVNID